jgi:hypothetical protein
LPLDDPKRMLNFGPDADLDLLDLIDQGVELFGLVQRRALARSRLAMCQLTLSLASGRLAGPW